jgi:hypothetical protein
MKVRNLPTLDEVQTNAQRAAALAKKNGMMGNLNFI